jgi:hypothetical protein
MAKSPVLSQKRIPIGTCMPQHHMYMHPRDVHERDRRRRGTAVPVDKGNQPVRMLALSIASWVSITCMAKTRPGTAPLMAQSAHAADGSNAPWSSRILIQLRRRYTARQVGGANPHNFLPLLLRLSRGTSAEGGAGRGSVEYRGTDGSLGAAAAQAAT